MHSLKRVRRLRWKVISCWIDCKVSLKSALKGTHKPNSVTPELSINRFGLAVSIDRIKKLVLLSVGPGEEIFFNIFLNCSGCDIDWIKVLVAVTAFVRDILQGTIQHEFI